MIKEEKEITKRVKEIDPRLMFIHQLDDFPNIFIFGYLCNKVGGKQQDLDLLLDNGVKKIIYNCETGENLKYTMGTWVNTPISLGIHSSYNDKCKRFSRFIERINYDGIYVFINKEHRNEYWGLSDVYLYKDKTLTKQDFPRFYFPSRPEDYKLIFTNIVNYYIQEYGKDICGNVTNDDNVFLFFYYMFHCYKHFDKIQTITYYSGKKQFKVIIQEEFNGTTNEEYGKKYNELCGKYNINENDSNVAYYMQNNERSFSIYYTVQIEGFLLYLIHINEQNKVSIFKTDKLIELPLVINRRADGIYYHKLVSNQFLDIPYYNTEEIIENIPSTFNPYVIYYAYISNGQESLIDGVLSEWVDLDSLRDSMDPYLLYFYYTFKIHQIKNAIS